MATEVKRTAVIYCRVSSKKQKVDGSGLDSQEHRCREYAAARGYVVDEVFFDDMTGGGDFMNRPGMVELLRYLGRGSRADGYVVIFDDLKRFARDTEFHIRLRQRLAARNATVECLNFTFEDTPEGKFVETIIAAQGELERLQNKRQTLQKMKARLERGYYVFSCPTGYKYNKSENGNVLVRNEPLASIIAEALDGYASGRFQLQAEVKRFLESHPEYPRDRSGVVLNQHVANLLTRTVYAGYVEAPKWGVSLRKGHHAPLISFETFQKIQDRLNGKARVPARKNLNADFPLRGAVICGHCSTPLTACWAKGKTALHPYYHCPKRGCESYGKSIRRAKIEGEFESMLMELKPAPGVFAVARAMFKDLWDHRLASAEARTSGLKAELAKIEKQVEQFLDRIADAETPSVIAVYENRIRKLEEQKALIAEKVASCGRPVRTFEETLRTSLDFLANPQNLWASDHLEDKRAVLKLTFADRLAYVRNEGFRTLNLAFPFKALTDFSGGRLEMARPERFELPTPGFVGRCSIQLSYGRVLLDRLSQTASWLGAGILA